MILLFIVYLLINFIHCTKGKLNSDFYKNLNLKF